MPQTSSSNLPYLQDDVSASPTDASLANRKPPRRSEPTGQFSQDRLLTVDDVARRLSVSRDWVWDHSSRKLPFLPVIRMGDGTLRFRASRIEAFITEREQTTERQQTSGLRSRRK